MDESLFLHIALILSIPSPSGLVVFVVVVFSDHSCNSVFIGERAKRARHSQVCSIENRGYIYIYIIYYV